MWAGLNLTTADLPRHGNPRGNGTPWYPLELVRAVAMLWLFAGLRVDEILRLRRRRDPLATATPTRTAKRGRVPARRADEQDRHRVHQAGRPAPSATRSRPGKTSGRAQPKFEDRKTGELVDVLLAYRGARLGEKYVNQVLIPLLCRKAGCARARTSAVRSPGTARGRRSPASSTTPRTRCRCSSCRPGSGTHRRTPPSTTRGSPRSR